MDQRTAIAYATIGLPLFWTLMLLLQCLELRRLIAGLRQIREIAEDIAQAHAQTTRLADGVEALLRDVPSLLDRERREPSGPDEPRTPQG